MLRRVLFCAASAIAVTAAANAGDVYRAPEAAGYKDTPYAAVNWSGLYVGIGGGYGWNSNTNAFEHALGGGQIGYNIQRGNIVLGLETDIQSTYNADDGYSGKPEVDWFGTVRGRLGYSFGPALIYGTGGFAYADAATPKENMDPGWAAGGGIEYMYTTRWSARAEYQFLSLDAGHGASPAGHGHDDRLDAHTFRAGFNYYIGYDPVKF